jgi:hypothetical protein
VSSSNLLKTFGAGTDVIGQLATDKSLRRKSTGTVRGFDITSGQLVEQVELVGTGDPATAPSQIKHTLARVPQGALVLRSDTDDIRCSDVALNHVVIEGTLGAIVTLWIV